MSKIDELVTMTGRRHPDIFTPEEAVEYLRLDSERGLETLRNDYGLTGFSGVNKGFRYWREDLDRVALLVYGRGSRVNRPVITDAPRLKIAGRR